MRRFGLACLLAACAPTGVASGGPPTPPPDWSFRDAAGLRIAAPTVWLGPQVLPALEPTGPRAWIEFRDPAGAEAITLMTWRDATASSLAASQFQGELPKGDPPRQLTLVEGTQTRTVVSMSGYAQWSDAGGAHMRGSSTPTLELRRRQEQVALRLGVAGGPP